MFVINEASEVFPLSTNRYCTYRPLFFPLFFPFFLYVLLFPPHLPCHSQLLVLIYLSASSSSSSFTPTSFKPFNPSAHLFIPFQKSRNSYLPHSSHQHLTFPLSCYSHLSRASPPLRTFSTVPPCPPVAKPVPRTDTPSPAFHLTFFDNKGSGGRGVTIVTPGYKKQLTSQ